MDPEASETNKRDPGFLAPDDSRNSAHPETVIEMGGNEITDPNAASYRSTVSGPVPVDDAAESEDNSSSCVINVNSSDSLGGNYRICRICHLSPKESGKSLMDLIELGCECKGELEAVHQDCGEAWFAVRGNSFKSSKADCAKFVASLRKTSKVLVIMDLWKNGMTIDPLMLVIVHQIATEGVCKDNHCVIS